MLMVRELGIGGSERQLSMVARGLDRARFTVHVGCFRDDGLRRRELDEAGIPVVRFAVDSFVSPAIVSQAFALRRYVKRHGIRLVHSFDLPTGLFMVPALAILRGAIPVSSQRAHRELAIQRYLPLIRLTDKLARSIVVNSQQMRRHLIDDERVPESKVHLCYNGIDLTAFQPPAPGAPRPEAAAGSFNIGVVCALRPEKDLATLLRAFAQLRTSVAQPMRLLIVGDGPCRDEWQQLAREIGIAQDVLFVPATSTVTPWLHAIDVFVLPSVSEALSNSLMEAMACGCCAVASRVGGNPELVAHESTGLLFEKQDTAGLIHCLQRLVGQPELRQRLSHAGMTRIHAEFSIQASAERMGAIYRQMLAR